MTKYEKLKKDPESFLSLIGYTLDEFCSFLPYFSKCFMEYVQNWTLEGKRRKKRKYTSYKNSAFESVEDMLPFILMDLRKASTQDVHGALFEMSQPNANKWIHRTWTDIKPCVVSTWGVALKRNRTGQSK